MMTVFQVVLLIEFVVAVALCWFKGGHPERWGVTLVLAVLIVDHFAPNLSISGFRPWSALVDLVLWAALVQLALTGNRWWPFFAAGAQFLALILHLSLLIGPDIGWRAFVSAQIGLTALLLLALMAGVVERRLATERPVFDAAFPWRVRPTSGAT